MKCSILYTLYDILTKVVVEVTLVYMQEFFGAYAGRMDECISSLRKECSLDLDVKVDIQPSEEFSEDWTMFQNAFHLIQICGKPLVSAFNCTRLCPCVVDRECQCKAQMEEIPQKIRKLNCYVHIYFVLAWCLNNILNRAVLN